MSRKPYVLKPGTNLRRVPSAKLEEGITSCTDIAKFLHAHDEHVMAANVEELVMSAQDELARRNNVRR